MKAWRCLCGSYEVFGSIGPQACQVCPECGTVPGDLEPIPHDWVTEEVRLDGVVVSVRTFCKRCGSRGGAEKKGDES